MAEVRDIASAQVSSIIQKAEAMGLRPSKVTAVESKVRIDKAEQDLLRSMALTVEDNPWQRIQFTNKFNSLAPTFDPTALSIISFQNNTLRQCIAAMMSNIDGTGFDIINADGSPLVAKEGEPDPPAVKTIKAFFNEPYPGISFHTMRQQIRENLETTGNAYIEVIRDQTGKLALLSPMDAKLTRLIRHDDLPIPVDREINRTGQEGGAQTVKLLIHERRFVQIIGLQARFFKQYKATRLLNAQTGVWQTDPKEKMLPQDNASEVLHFWVDRDVLTPYGVPRWINQIPSILGSRKAEELNMEFFDHGGVPPLIIAISGGTLTPVARKSLTDYLAGAAKTKLRGVVMEISPSGGDLQSSSQVKTEFQTFGDTQGTDSKFEKYDDKCTQRVRSAYRLPPLLIGLAQDYNYATAMTAISMAEEQVFKPERFKFDELINATLMKELDPTGQYLYRSKPMTAKFMDEQIKALTLAKGMTDGENFIDELNEVAGLNLQFDQEQADITSGAAAQQQAQQVAQGLQGDTGTQGTGTGGGGGKYPVKGFSKSSTGIEGSSAAIDPSNGAVVKDDTKLNLTVTSSGNIRKMDQNLLTNLANDWAAYLGGERHYTRSHVIAMDTLIKSMTPSLRQLFAENVAQKVMKANYDPNGVTELLSCAGDLLVKKFSPDEARDDHGRWTDGDGGAAHELFKKLAASGGFTYQPVTKDSPTSGYALSILPGNEKVIAQDKVDEASIKTYLDDHKDLFEKDHSAHVGGWLDTSTGKVYLDVSVIEPDKEKAIELAKANNQEGIYDLAGQQTIIVTRGAAESRQQKSETGTVRSTSQRFSKRDRGGDSEAASPAQRKAAALIKSAVQLIATDGTAHGAGGEALEASPKDRTLYVSRPVTNAAEIVAWAKKQGFETTLPPEDMHVTVCYSKQPVDWSRYTPDTDPIRVQVGLRKVQTLGPKGAIVLTFESLPLAVRWKTFRDGGASWDWPYYQPHVTLTYSNPNDIDPDKIQPYEGVIELGAETFAPVEEDWGDDIVEKYDEDQPRDDHGRWTTGGGTPDVASLKPDELVAYKTHVTEQFWNQLKDFPAAVAQYKALTDEKGKNLTDHGKILNVDFARELSPDYSASKDARSLLAAAVHEPASDFIKKLYAQDLISQPAEGESPLVMLTAGGTGAGKSTAIENVAEISDISKTAQVIYDTNMNTYDSALLKINQALDAGKDVRIAYVYRDPTEAMVNGALPRAMRMGRTVPAENQSITHAGSYDVVSRLAAKFEGSDHVKFAFIDNSLGKGNAAETTLDKLKGRAYNTPVAELKASAKQEYEAGRISATVYRGTVGDSYE
jgi:PBSX family phage portal protein